jgi:exopolyphosphatase/guanosine-5'-triphosphate,3'-diphosphate pyrophosphatase
MKIATIDLGTNTFHLLIGEQTKQGYREIIKKRIYVQLGQEGFKTSSITPDAQQRALRAMVEFKKLIDDHNIQYTYAVATSAIRNANNGAELIEHISSLTGIQVDIISGTQESMLIYKGVKFSSAIRANKALVMDIGGGSVEFIVCNQQEALWERSFEIGAQRLLDQFHQHDPILPDELIQLENYLEEALQPLFQAIDTYQPTQLIGTSGAFTTLVSMHKAQAKHQTDTEAIVYELPKKYIKQAYEKLRYMTNKERLQIPGLAQERIDMIVVSSALIHFIIRKSRISHIVASSYSLKMGLFLQAVQELEAKNYNLLSS